MRFAITYRKLHYIDTVTGSTPPKSATENRLESEDVVEINFAHVQMIKDAFRGKGHASVDLDAR